MSLYICWLELIWFLEKETVWKPQETHTRKTFISNFIAMYRTYMLQWQLIKTISYCKFAIVFILLEISRSFNFYEDFFQVVSLEWRSFSSGLSSDSWTATKVSLSSSAVEPSTISSGLHGNWFFLPLALPFLPQGWRPPCFLLASLYERRNKSLMKYKKNIWKTA